MSIRTQSSKGLKQNTSWLNCRVHWTDFTMTENFFSTFAMYLRHNFKNSYMITGVSVQHHVWCLSPVFFKTSSVETHDSASKNEEGCELDKHSSCLNHMSMSEDNRNRNAPHSRCSSHKFSSIYPTALYNWQTEKKIIKYINNNNNKKSQLEAVWDEY